MITIFTKCKKYFTPSQIESERNNNFNIIRVFAAFLVIYGHMGVLTGVAAETLFSQPVSTIAVKIFFTISGYLVTKSFLSDTNFLRYITRRIFRIFPALIAVIVFSTLVIGAHYSTLSIAEYFSHPQTYRYLFGNILFHPEYTLPGVFTGYTYPNVVNGSIWIIPGEFLMYLILPAVLVIFKKLGSTKIGVILFMLISLISSLLYISIFSSARFVIWGNDIFQLFPLIPYFFAGCLFTFPEFKKILNLQFAVVLALFSMIAKTGIVINEILVFISLPYLVLSFALSEKPIFSEWFKKSDFSYGIFLWGFPIQQIVGAKYAQYGLSVFILATISYLIAFIPAIVSWYFIEKPMQKIGKKITIMLKNKESSRIKNNSITN